MIKIDLFRGYFGIGIFNPKYEENIGTLWRHAQLFNASFIFVIGNKILNHPTNTTKTQNHIPLYYYKTFDDFISNLPKNVKMVDIELDEKSIMLHDFKHPENAIYLLGSKGTGLPTEIINRCDDIVQIYTPRPQSMNVATSGTMIMYDRTIKLRN